MSNPSADSQNFTVFVPVIENKLYLANAPAKSKNNEYRYISTSDYLEYSPLCDDFGPMNISSVMRFIDLLQEEMTYYSNKTIVYMADRGRRPLTNAAFLMGSYLILKLDYDPERVTKIFESIGPYAFEPFRDATFSPVDFGLSLMDCWKALVKGKSLGWIRSPERPGAKWGMIGMEEYEHYENPLNGDLVQVVPNKFVAFKGPVDLPGGAVYQDEGGFRRFGPGYYVPVFRALGVTTVVRLNERCYDELVFTRAGIRHVDLEFRDCTSPPADVVTAFLEAADETEGSVAVHCKAGLGRTGTLIALDMMRRHGFCARSAMGWLRIMRPGSVIGDQQAFLCAMERCGGLTLPTRNRSLLARAWASVELQRFSGSAAVLARQVELGLQMRQRAAAAVAVAAPSSTPAAATAAS